MSYLVEQDLVVYLLLHFTLGPFLQGELIYKDIWVL